MGEHASRSRFTPVQAPRSVVGLVLALGTALVLALGIVAVGAPPMRVRPADAAFPGANGKIVFSRGDNPGFSVWVMDPDGTDQTRLTFSGSNSAAAWSGDGNKIAFTSDRDGNNEIYVMNADGTSQTRLTANAAYDTLAAWSPDGTQIAFMSDRDGHQEIYVMGADGSDQTRLTFDAAGTNNAYPAWSPDGSRVAFRRGFSDIAGSHVQIVTMDPDGTNQDVVIEHVDAVANAAGPDWSPDGAQLVYWMADSTTNAIHVVDVDGTNHHTVASASGVYQVPVFSPDGTKISYAACCDDGPAQDVYVMNADGTNNVRLTNSTATAPYSEPNWQRVPECVVSTTGLLGWWAGEGDLSAKVGPGLTGSSSFGTGVVGQGFAHDATADLSTAGLATVSSAVTVETWFKTTDNGTSQALAGRWNIDPSTTDDSYTLWVTVGDQLVWQVQRAGAGGSGDFAIAVRPEIYDGTFHHAAGTFDGVISNLYLDGNLVASTPAPGVLEAAGAEPFRLGRFGSATPYPLTGVLDEPAVFNRALNAGEIAAIHNAGANGKCGANPSAEPSVSIGDASVWEGDAKNRSVLFPVTLSEPSVAPVTVDYVLAGVDATPGNAKTPGVDFNNKAWKTKTLTFKPGQVAKYVGVAVYSDAEAEATESFSVTLSNPTGGYVLDRSVGTGTIFDEDAEAANRVTVGDASLVEGDSGKRGVKFRVTLSKQAASLVTVDYVIVPVSATGGYKGGALPPGTDLRDLLGTTRTLKFKPSATTGLSGVQKAVNVLVYPDVEIEGDETFQIVLSNVQGPAVLADATGLGTILDDD